MPVKVKCTNCEKVLAAPDAARGKAIKCPQCQTRIAVPAEESSAKPSAKPKSKKPAKPLDSEAALAAFDMRRAEDTEARICPKCGFDMQYQDEEDSECPKCGYDSSEGGLGIKARKKAMKGPDPDDFYPGLFSQAWKFVGRNNLLALRTVIYTMVCLTISLGCAFLYLNIAMWPPRAFLALVFVVSILVIPGWMWYLDTEVIKLTLERKDKFKRLNFDFFLASAMGLAFLFWCVAIVAPIELIPAGIGYALVNYSGMPEFVLPICICIGLIPALWMLPVVMSHMAMPVQYRGWLIWKVVPIWARNLKPLSIWLMYFILTNIPLIAGGVVIAVVSGPSVTNVVEVMESNADIARKKFDQQENPNAKKKGQAAKPIVQLPDPQPVSYMPFILPIVILYLMCISNGITCMFNMRTNAQFTYYFRSSLDLVERAKEYKYVATERRDKDDDEPKTTTQLMVEAIVFVLVFDLLGLVGGMLVGTLTNMGVGMGILTGLFWMHMLAMIAIWMQCLTAAFQDSALWGLISLFVGPIGFLAFVFQNWEERKEYFIKLVTGWVIEIILIICAVVFGVLAALAGQSGVDTSSQQEPPNMQAPMNPGQPGQMPPQ